jgi:hypothetical protein
MQGYRYLYGTTLLRVQRQNRTPGSVRIKYRNPIPFSLSGNTRPPRSLHPRTLSVLSFLNGIELAQAYPDTNAARAAAHSW